jgi:hypothetical protein
VLRNVLTVLADHQISNNYVFTEYIKSLGLTVDKIKKYAISPNTFLSKSKFSFPRMMFGYFLSSINQCDSSEQLAPVSTVNIWSSDNERYILCILVFKK